MAKLLVAFPDDLLERIDMQARARHESRSDFLRKLADRELDTGVGRAAHAGNRTEKTVAVKTAKVRSVSKKHKGKGR
ncbi:MAG TPA: ribbon-helix-helix protein, CopG family [Solirubrobacteraceae bacterium]|jgi:metal-responsive CopG/Arc/MetJ family transcriptional regulator